MESLPKELKSIGVVMSNFDHQIILGTEEKLREGGVFGEYTARNFWAAVWSSNPGFSCVIRRYHAHIDTITAGTLEEIMEIASERYGED